MKRIKIILIISLLFYGCLASAQSSTTQKLQLWLSSHIDTVVIIDTSQILSYSMTKIYQFYDDNFVVMTLKNFINDTSLNITPAFCRIWYKDINIDKLYSITLAPPPKSPVHLFTLSAKRIYYIIGKEETPLTFWRCFNEPSEVELYLPEDALLSQSIVYHLMQLATLYKSKE